MYYFRIGFKIEFLAPKKESHPKAEAKKEAPPAAEASEEPKKVEKGKTWVDLLPPTPMPLDSFKRLYSNCPSSTFRQTFLPLLWNGGEIPKSPNNEVHLNNLSLSKRIVFRSFQEWIPMAIRFGSLITNMMKKTL